MNTRAYSIQFPEMGVGFIDRMSREVVGVKSAETRVDKAGTAAGLRESFVVWISGGRARVRQ